MSNVIVLMPRTIHRLKLQNNFGQRPALFDYIMEEYQIDLDNLQASTLVRLIEDPDTPEELKALLAVRLQVTTTSTTKYRALSKGVTRDGRLKGTLQFCGASRTGRWSGRTFQPQNLPSKGLLHNDDIAIGIEILKAGCADLVYENVMHLCSSAIRGCIIAPPGKKLVVADLANIEGRVLAWLGDEEWKLQAFRDYDAGTGHDLYKLAYAKAFGIDVKDVDKHMRQVGKVMELALGYAGGVGAFLTFADVYGIDLEAMARGALDTLPEDVRDEAESFFVWCEEQKRSTFGLSREAFIVCDAFKRLWRQAHPNITSLWAEMQYAVVSATHHPGETFRCRRLKVRRDGKWLRIGLPSGRVLCYPDPQVADDGEFLYLGSNQLTRRWERQRSYGGKLVENVVQAIARDVMASSMPEIEARGFQIVLTVHDEIICETPDLPAYTSDWLSLLMSTPPPWVEGLPLAAAGFESYRYRKD